MSELKKIREVHRQVPKSRKGKWIVLSFILSLPGFLLFSMYAGIVQGPIENVEQFCIFWYSVAVWMGALTVTIKTWG